ncbi:MAG: hypothetical protein IPL64_09910 [Flavobacteriales bacterium]|nr:hypothetical protein [Flavobacteriales bacterium]
MTDNAGLTATCTQTVTVSDNVPPTITLPGRRCRQHQQWLYRYWCRPRYAGV